MEDLKNWLEADDLNLGEQELFKIIMSMTDKVDPSKISELLQCIRFTLLGSSHFNKNIINSAQFQSILNDKTELKNHVKTAAKYYSSIQVSTSTKTIPKQTDKPRFAADLVLISGGHGPTNLDGPTNRIDIWDLRAENSVLNNLVVPF